MKILVTTKMYIAFFIISFFSMFLVTNESLAQVKTFKEAVGKIKVNDTEIKADVYKVANPIQFHFLDTINNTLSLQLAKKSKKGQFLTGNNLFVVYDYFQDKVKWVKEINTKNDRIDLREFYFFRSENITKVLNRDSGLEEAVYKKFNVLEIDTTNKIFIGYETKIESNNNLGMYFGATGAFVSYSFGGNGAVKLKKLKAYDYISKELLWEEKMKSDQGWKPQIFKINNLNYLISDKIYCVDSRNGIKWSHAIEMGELIDDGISKKFYIGCNSNILYRDGIISFASKDKLIQVDQDGNLLFDKKLPSNKTGLSFIRYLDGKLSILNYGRAWNEDYSKTRIFGKPYYAQFDPRSGDILDQTHFESVRGIKKLTKQNDTLKILGTRGIFQFDINTNKALKVKNLTTKKTGLTKDFFEKGVYVLKDTKFVDITKTDTTRTFVYSTKKFIRVLDAAFKVIEDINPEGYFLVSTNFNNYVLLSNSTSKKLVLINAHGDQLAEIELAHFLGVHGTKILGKNENVFYMIDLKDYFPDIRPINNTDLD